MIIVWTDGACSREGCGGWAWATEDGWQANGGVPNTTNQRMEQYAVVKALSELPEKNLRIVSDSAYVVNCFLQEWWRGWEMPANGDWRKAKSRKPVSNSDLWSKLFLLVRARTDVGLRVEWQHVRGHSGLEMNDLVDKLAVEAKTELMSMTREARTP